MYTFTYTHRQKAQNLTHNKKAHINDNIKKHYQIEKEIDV